MTKISYTTLGVVPVLATLWPGVHYFVTEINQHIHTTISEQLPLSWAMAFFAALATVIAKLFYQACAPEVIRQTTLNQFVTSQMEDYIQRPIAEKLEAAISVILGDGRHDLENILRSIGDKYSIRLEHVDQLEIADNYKELSSEDKHRFLRYGMISGISQTLKQKLDLCMQEEYKAKFDKYLEMRNIGIIGQADRIEYLKDSRRNLPFMAGVSFLYGLAIFLVLKIAWHQSQTIFDVAGASFQKIFFD